MSTATLLPLLAKMGDYFKAGVEHYNLLKSMGSPLTPDILAAFIQVQMRDWNPQVKGKAVLDDNIKAAGAQLLAGLIFNLAK